MSTPLNDEIRSKLTEHKNNYKLCNLNLLSCYGGLYPATLTKLSYVIFTQILSNKMYHKKDSKYYDEQEEKRIHTSLSITPTILLENCHPTKYRLEGKDANKDIGNIVKRINELDDNNIFYVWKCGYPKNYMFVLERDIGLWKFYNPKAYVTPKTLKKIILSTRGMCNSMFKILQESGDKSNIHDVRKSFCEFISGIVKKLDPSIGDTFPKWDEGSGYKEYLINVNNIVRTLSPYQGLEIDSTFFDRLPLEVKLKFDTKPRKKRGTNASLESDLLPKDGGLIKTPKRKSKTTSVKEAKTKFDTFVSIEPLKNANSFCQYYRSLIKSTDKDAKFHEYKIETPPAAVILDKLKESNKDEDFVRSWILFYVESKLKGNNIRNRDKTSLRTFQKTYDEYSSRYIGCGV
jgi:hypothetical protein